MRDCVSPTTSSRRWLALIRRGDEQGFLSSKPESVSCETGRGDLMSSTLLPPVGSDPNIVQQEVSR